MSKTNTNQKQIEVVPLALIEPDAKQPRKFFNAARLGDLQRSIQEHGIMNPLLIERTKGGKYLLVDGERRYRASKELRLKEVPVIIVEPQKDTERLIQQFHIQEQHEGWTALEKAIAVTSLADELKVDVASVAKMLGIPVRTIRDHVAFGKLLERSYFEKNEIPVAYSNDIIRLKHRVKKYYRDGLKKEFTKDMERGLEKAIIHRIKNKDIDSPGGIIRVGDSVRSNPSLIEEFIKKDAMTVDKLFTSSNAQVAWYHRNIKVSASILGSHIKVGIPLGVHKLFRENEEGFKTEHAALKNAYKQLGDLLSKIG